MPSTDWLYQPATVAIAFLSRGKVVCNHQIQLENQLAPSSEIAMQDQLYNQTERQMGYCGRFKAWQMAAMFMCGVMMLSGGLPLLVFNVIPWLCSLVGLV